MIGSINVRDIERIVVERDRRSGAAWTALRLVDPSFAAASGSHVEIDDPARPEPAIPPHSRAAGIL
jgi:hypothetical protein